MPGDRFARLTPSRWQINPLDPQDFVRLLAEIKAAGRPALRGAVHAWGLGQPLADQDDPAGLHSAMALSSAGALHLVQALLAHSEALPRLWLVTAGAQPAPRQSGPLNPAQAALWGLGSVIAL